MWAVTRGHFSLGDIVVDGDEATVRAAWSDLLDEPTQTRELWLVEYVGGVAEARLRYDPPPSQVPAYNLERAVAIAEQIALLPAEHHSDDVLVLFHSGEYELFHFMDETPGHECFDALRTDGTAYGEWHRRLRAARNDPEATWPFSLA